MYRNSKDYKRMAMLAISLYLDYELYGFPLDVNIVCKKLGISLVPYSEFTESERHLLLRRSNYGFLAPFTNNNPPMIFYNDKLESIGCIRQTILHEIKHYIDEDSVDDPEDDDLADYFAKYLACPIPYLIACNISNPNEIIATFKVSSQMAKYIINNLENRKKRYGTQIFDYEKPLLKHLCPTIYGAYYAR